MNNKDYTYISIIIIILILIIYCFINLNKYKNYNEKVVDKNINFKNNNFKYSDFKYDDIKKTDNFYYEMPPANNDIHNDEKGYLNELIKINNNNKEGTYNNVFNNKINIIDDNEIGFNTKTKEQKKELPFANINVSYLQR